MPEKQTAASAATGDQVAEDVPTPEDAYVAALLREREGYALYGRQDRVKDVDAELKRLGVDRPGTHKDQERAVSKPRERRGSSQ